MKSLAIAAMFSLPTGCCLEIVNGAAGWGEDAGDVIDAGKPTDAGHLVGCTPDSGVTIYAHSQTDLYKIDPVTWVATDVGSFGGADSMTDLAISSANEIYVTSDTSLYTVNPATGAATALFQTDDDFDALTFLADGTLLGVGADGTVSKIDLSFQEAEIIGVYGEGYNSSGDIVAVADGTIYATSTTSPLSFDGDFLVKVDPTTGAATTVGGIGFQNVWGLGYYGGRIIGFTQGGQILEIDPATGAGSLLSSNGPEYWGAGVSPAVAAICP
jgi:hypothetical protein